MMKAINLWKEANVVHWNQAANKAKQQNNKNCLPG